MLNAPPRIHLPTAAAIGILAYATANLAHEIIGHGAAAWLLGGGCRFVSTADIRLRPDTPSATFALIAAAGTFVNFAAAGPAAFALRRGIGTSSPVRSFLWLTMAVNLFVAAGYASVSPFIFFGDWHNIVVTANASWMWRPLIGAFGLAAWWLSWRLCRQELRTLVGTDRSARRFARSLLWTGYAAGAVVMTAAALLSPLPYRWALLVGLGSTAGLTAPLLILPFAVGAEARVGNAGFTLRPDPPWLAAGLAAAAGLLILGRGFQL